MSIFTTTTKAYWRKHPESRTCHACKKEDVTTFQTGHKSRRDKHVQWWGGFSMCQECKDQLPDVPPIP